MTIKADLVEELFSQLNCAQTVFGLHAEELELNKETAFKIASGFGGGMACAETCGAVTGAYMVIGMKHGHFTSDPEAKAATKQKIQQFNEKFKAEHSSLICKELTGYDISTEEGAAAANNSGVFANKCLQLIKTACDILEKHF
ncbi:C-GCAxxG-C-C family protein [Prolixibacteraceae bacterium Z1-6]|uniref:C-GCAxxG-C-C family protein n=1 Tax=Draconibacterium aestuarii TaxID=2998507 RepID=A0A9X3J7N9_9BACT|nr:C-GCAxxG-C-C family protein [Prolixibacteraceae bacterium Z1-6]